jgi:hypothetical protein
MVYAEVTRFSDIVAARKPSNATRTIRLTVYTIMGQEVRTLVQGASEPGSHP